MADSASSDEAVRKKAFRLYMTLSVAQLLTGLSLLLCSCLGLLKYDAASEGVPYVVGGYIIGALLIFSSLLAFRVYNKGPEFDISETSKNEVRCAVNWHRMTSFSMVLSCIISIAIIWMYGLCLEEDTPCSYETHQKENKIIAIVSLVIGFIGLMTSATGIYFIHRFGRVFGMILVQSAAGNLTFGGFEGSRSGGRVRQGRSNTVLQTGQQQQLQNEAFTPLHGRTDGYTNLGFIPLELPPYSPSSEVPSYTASQMSSQQTSAGENNIMTPTNVKYYGGGVSIIPDGPPPPYSERVENSVCLQNVENVHNSNQTECSNF